MTRSEKVICRDKTLFVAWQEVQCKNVIKCVLLSERRLQQLYSILIFIWWEASNTHPASTLHCTIMSSQNTAQLLIVLLRRLATTQVHHSKISNKTTNLMQQPRLLETVTNQLLCTNLEPAWLEEHYRTNELLPNLLSDVETKAPILVVQGSLLLITENHSCFRNAIMEHVLDEPEYTVGVVDLLEHLLSLNIVGILVRMILQS